MPRYSYCQASPSHSVELEQHSDSLSTTCITAPRTPEPRNSFGVAAYTFDGGLRPPPLPASLAESATTPPEGVSNYEGPHPVSVFSTMKRTIGLLCCRRSELVAVRRRRKSTRPVRCFWDHQVAGRVMTRHRTGRRQHAGARMRERRPLTNGSVSTTRTTSISDHRTNIPACRYLMAVSKWP